MEQLITKLQPNDIFVYGSNTLGRNGKGAALTAKQRFGARDRVGEGMSGTQCYAFPTLNAFTSAYGRLRLVKRTLAELECSRNLFYKCALSHPTNKFLLTKIGCGLAGYPEDDMINLFATGGDIPLNIIVPDDWEWALHDHYFDDPDEPGY